MRLRDIQEALREALAFSISAEPFNPHPSSTAYKVSNYSGVRHTLDLFASVVPFQADANKLIASELFLSPISSDDSFSASQNVWSNWEGAFNGLGKRARDLLTALDALLPEQDPELTFSLKLPDGIEDLEKLEGEIHDVRDTIDQILLLLDQSQTAFAGFDTGSSYLNFLVKTTKSLAIVASLAFVVRQYVDIYLGYRERIVQIQAIESDVKVRQVIVNFEEKLLEGKTRELAVGLAKTGEKETEAEVVSRLVVTIEKLSGLVLRGAEFRLLVGAPEADRQKVEASRKTLPLDLIKQLEAIPNAPRLTKGEHNDTTKQGGN